MFVKTLLLVSLVMLAGCLSSSPRNQGLPVREPVFAKSSPTGTLDVTQGDDLTTIELLKEKAHPNPTIANLQPQWRCWSLTRLALSCQTQKSRCLRITAERITP